MNPLAMIKNYLNIGIAVVAFGVGFYANNVWHGYKESILIKQVQQQLVKQDKVNRESITELQITNQELEDSYQQVEDKLNELKSKKQVTNVPCKLTPSAISVWNSSIESVPKATTGTSETTAEVASTGGISIEDVLTNEVENKRRFDLNQAQIDAIIKWNVDTYGK